MQQHVCQRRRHHDFLIDDGDKNSRLGDSLPSEQISIDIS